MPMGRPVSGGFTTLELLIGIVVVAILAAIAIPSYSAYVIRGQRAAAKAALEQAAQYLERNYTTSGCYNYTATGDCTTQPGTPTVALPAALKSSPNGATVTYAITVAFAPAAGFNNGQYYRLSAAPCSTSASACASPSNASFADATCGALTIDNTGAQGFDPSGTGTGTVYTTSTTVNGKTVTVADCWQR
jgi:type IV pilus assembly protein PilE